MIAIENLGHVDAGAARAARERYRSGRVEPTSGVAPGFTQANMIVLPRDWAFDFLLYAQRNPKACPVLDVSDPGSHATLLAQAPICAPTCHSTAFGATASLPKKRPMRRPPGRSIPISSAS